MKRDSLAEKISVNGNRILEGGGEAAILIGGESVRWAKDFCFEMLGKNPSANADVITCSALTSYVCASMKMQDDSLRPISSIVRTWEPAPPRGFWLNIWILQQASVEDLLVGWWIDLDEAIILVELDRCADFYFAAVVDNRSHKLVKYGLLVSPFRVLTEVRREEVDEPEGQYNRVIVLITAPAVQMALKGCLVISLSLVSAILDALLPNLDC